MVNVEKLRGLDKNDIKIKLNEVINFWKNHFYGCNTSFNRVEFEKYIKKIYEKSEINDFEIIYASDLDNLKLDVKIPEKTDINIYENFLVEIINKIYQNSNVIESSDDEMCDFILELNKTIKENFDFYSTTLFNNITFNKDLNDYVVNIFDDYNFIVLYDLFNLIGIIEDNDFNLYKNFIIETGVFSLIVTNNYCVVYECPTKIVLDQNNRFHSEDSSALIYNNSEKYYWHGVEIEKFWILNKTAITKDTIVREKNAEKRRILKEILGSKEYAKTLNIEIIDQDIDQKNNPVILYKTVDKDELLNKYLYFANVICPSTGREYFISVPEMSNVWEAVAWTFNMNKEEYVLTEES